jgi:hypothetical protein
VLDARLVCLGDDPDGQAIEVITVEGSKEELIVIHAMALRKKYRDQYEEAKSLSQYLVLVVQEGVDGWRTFRQLT